MKERVLSNIVRYVTENQVNVPLSEFAVDMQNSFKYTLGFSQPTFVWADLKENLKFDDISKHLLDQFSDAIENQNYKGAAYMKKEINNHWMVDDYDLWSIGRDYLVKLKNGMMNSNEFSEYETVVGDILYSFSKKGFEEIDYIYSEIKRIRDIINNTPASDVREEMLHAVLEMVDKDLYHPVLIIDTVETYFRFLIEEID